MAQEFSVEAVLSAVDKSFSKTMNEAVNSVYKLGQETGKATSGVTKGTGQMKSGFLDMAGAFGAVQIAGKAINVVSDAVSGAVSRIDTLNNSSRVFENMGYSASQTSSMMKNLENSIKGLPTTLDSAVKGVQLLASTTGDLDRAQQVWSALNDAVIGFGGTAEDAERATLQLSQAFAAGKIDAETWNSMLDAGLGPTLNAIAKQMGITSAELKEGLSSGKISVDEFQKALIDLDQNGGGGLKSLHQIAKDSTAGIGTAFTNMKTAIERGVGNLILAFDKFITQLTGSGIATHLSNIGKAAEIAFSNMGKFLSWAGKNDLMKALAVAIGVAAAGLIAYGTAALIASGAMAVLNAVMAINPFVLLAIAIAAVVAALVYFFTQTKTGQKIWQTFTEGLGKAWDWLKEKASAVWGWITEKVITAATAVQNAWNGIKEFFSTLWEGIKTGAQTAWDFIVMCVTTPIEWIKTAWNTIVEFFNTLWENIKLGAQTAWNSVLEFLQPVIAGVQVAWQTIQAIVQTALSVLQNIIMIAMGILTGNWSMAWEGIKNLLGPIWEGIKNLVQQGIDSAHNILDNIMSKINSMFGNKWEEAKGLFQKGVEKCKKALDKAQELYQIGVEFVQGFIRGITAKIGDAVNAVMSLGRKAVAAAKSFFKIGSPSKVMRQYGSWFTEGFALGIGDEISAVKNAVHAVSKAAVLSPSINTTGLQSTLGSLNNAVHGNVNASLQMHDSSLQMQNNQLLRQLVAKSGDVYMDGVPVGHIVAPTVSQDLGQQVMRKGRWS